MPTRFQQLILVVIAVSFFNCKYFSFTPRSKKQQLREHPSVVIFDRIVDFRVADGGWPVSRQDFINKGVKYYEVMKDFHYNYTYPEIKDSNTTSFFFSDHIKDRKAAELTRKTELNTCNGQVNFWKEGERFLWKLKMK